MLSSQNAVLTSRQLKRYARVLTLGCVAWLSIPASRSQRQGPRVQVPAAQAEALWRGEGVVQQWVRLLELERSCRHWYAAQHVSIQLPSFKE